METVPQHFRRQRAAQHPSLDFRSSSRTRRSQTHWLQVVRILHCSFLLFCYTHVRLSRRNNKNTFKGLQREFLSFAISHVHFVCSELSVSNITYNFRLLHDLSNDHTSYIAYYMQQRAKRCSQIPQLLHLYKSKISFHIIFVWLFIRFNFNSKSCEMQVYGGTISIMIGSFARSQIGFGSPSASSSNTSCRDCAVSVLDVTILNSTARSSTSVGGSLGAFVRNNIKHLLLQSIF